jgi:tripartite-type tricarboxylate transporter receptor subunit TctC
MWLTKLTRAFASVLMAASLAPPAQAAPYPDRPIRLIVPYPAGGSGDVLARLVADGLSRRYGKAIIVENRSGAGGHIGAENVVHSPADGYTLMLATISHNGAFAIYKNLRYDPTKDLVPVLLIAESPNVLMVPVTSPIKSVKDLLNTARAQPGKLNYASAGIGSATHMAAELFKYMAHVDITGIPFKGGAPAIAAVLSGEVDLTFETGVTAHQAIATGRVRALAVTSKERSPSFPGLPTVAEAGVPGYFMAPWYTISVASGVPSAIISKLNTDINAVVASTEFRSHLDALGVVPLGGTQAEAVLRNQVETKRWTEVIRAAKIELD